MTVEELLDKKKIDYRASGQDYLVCCFNPDHDDSNPSMRIDRVLGIFHCLSCGFRGNLFSFFDEHFDNRVRLREQLRRKMEEIRAASIGMKFPVNTQFLDEGYRVSAKIIKEFEAFRSINKEYEGRIWFPVRDMKGRISSFIGRAEDPFATPKYMVLPRGAKLPLFPLTKLEPIQGRVMLVEGIFDLLNLRQYGLNNTITGFGIKNFKDRLKILSILGVHGLDICFDPDEPGQNAAEEVQEVAEDLGFNVRNINLKNNDPGALREESVRRLKEKLYG